LDGEALNFIKHTIMQLIRSKPYLCFLGVLILIFGVIDFFPWHGHPFFKYPGSDPRHYVWNFGWPLTWTIYDNDTPPYWITSPPRVYYFVLTAQGIALPLLLMLFWMLRKK